MSAQDAYDEFLVDDEEFANRKAAIHNINKRVRHLKMKEMAKGGSTTPAAKKGAASTRSTPPSEVREEPRGEDAEPKPAEKQKKKRKREASAFKLTPKPPPYTRQVHMVPCGLLLRRSESGVPSRHVSMHPSLPLHCFTHPIALLHLFLKRYIDIRNSKLR